ncbi:MAG TPA: hypothetical protein G4O12_04540 [Dehalococcoidia bacterium]|nr:hypothetical protein [Dehalococcoidia bacterium]
MCPPNLDRYLKTEKQKTFGYDFLQNAGGYEAWDDVKFGEEFDGEQVFHIKAEDMIAYAEGVSDSNRLFTDEEYAKESPYGELVPHPLFVVQITFWCIGVKGKGNWIRTPGARNPGQRIELYDQFHVGEEIHIKQKAYDRYIKRGKYYLTYQVDLYNQHNVKKATWWVNLILPKTKADILKFARGERGVEV